MFVPKIECVQYKAALAITVAIKGTSQAKFYKELGLKTLKFRRWCITNPTYHCICKNTSQREIILKIPY